MSVYVLEDSKSRNFSVGAKGATMPTHWVCFGSNDEIEVYNAVRYLTPTFTTSGLIRTNIGPADFRGGGLCYVEVMYGTGEGTANNDTPAGESPDDGTPPTTPDGDQNLGSNQSFTTMGGTAHITQSLETRERVRALGFGGGAAPDNQRAIGLKAGSVEGCEIIVPTMEYTYQQDRSRVTLNDIRRWMRLTGKTNDKVWKEFVRGEALFLGAEGQGAAFGKWTVTFKFKFAENRPAGDPRNIITPGLTITDKRGWDYVWTAYQEQITGAQLYPLPVGAYVERVYEEADFAGIGIGV